MDESGEDVYARRMRMAREAGINIRPPSPPSTKVTDVEEYDVEEIEEDQIVGGSKEQPVRLSPSPPTERRNVSPPYSLFTSSYAQPPSFYSTAPGMQPTPPAPNPTISSEPIHYTAAPTISSEPIHYTAAPTISSEPIHYTAAPTISSEPIHYTAAPTTISSEPTHYTSPPTISEPRTSLPGQRNFASRLMSKYGWQKGQSLGSTPATGLITPLQIKPDKSKKGTGIILNKNKIVEEYGVHGKMTRCIVLGNVVGIGEVDEDLVEEIGSECREKVSLPKSLVPSLSG